MPTKASFLAWEASWGRVLTLDQLKRRGWLVTNRCFLCLMEEESVNHSLLHCGVTQGLGTFSSRCSR